MYKATFFSHPNVDVDPDLVKTNCNFGTGEDKVTSAWEPRSPSSCAYLQILLDESTRSITTPPWMWCYSIARWLRPAFNWPILICAPGWREALVGVKCLAQEHNTMSPLKARTRTASSGGEPLTMRPPRLHICVHITLSYICKLYASSTLHRRNFKTALLLWKGSSFLLSTLRRKNSKTLQSPANLDLCLRKTWAGKSRDHHYVVVF